MKQPRDLRWRLALMLMATLPAVVVALAVVTVLTLARLENSRHEFDIGSRNAASQLAAQLDYPLISGQPALAIPAIDNLLQQPGLLAVRIHDASGAIWLSRQQVGGYRDAVTHEVTAPVQLVSATDMGDDWLGQPTASNPRVLGHVVLVTSDAHLVSREWTLLSEGLLVALVLLLFCLVLAWLVADRLMRWQEARSRRILQARWSHDLRTPLSGVTGMLELLSTTPLDPEQQHYTQSALSASKQLDQRLSGPAAERVDQVGLPAASRDWAGRRVLVVEDDPVSARYAEIQLGSLQVAVSVVGTGAEALARAREPWHLVLVDGELPDMMADELRQAWPLDSDAMPVFVALTAHDDEALLARFQAAGLHATLPKPLRLGALLSSVPS